LAFFSKTNVVIKILHNLPFCFESKTPISSLNFSAKIFKKSLHRPPGSGLQKRSVVTVRTLIFLADTRHTFEIKQDFHSIELPSFFSTSFGDKVTRLGEFVYVGQFYENYRSSPHWP
jgi:hypothetical protein